MPGQDRRTALCEQEELRLTGIDFIRVVDPHDQTVLQVFFVIDPDALAVPMVATADLPAEVPPDEVADLVTIESPSGGERLARVPVVRATYRQVTLDGAQRTVLEVETSEPGDFTLYRLTIHDDRVDRFMNGVEFSFKQGCPSDLDCEPRTECPPEDEVDFPVDYLARDFESFRGALLDFAAQRYPEWRERIEADVGVMLLEVMSALGDELSYVQDRYAREAYLETASQRRSLRRHTQLVDYRLHDGLAAVALLDVQAAAPGWAEAGQRVWAAPGGEPAIPFEVGEGLRDQREGRRFWLHPAWNSMAIHLPDESEPCLEVGSTELYLRSHLPIGSELPPPDEAEPVPPEAYWVGRLMVLKSTPEDPSLPARRHLVRVAEVVEHTVDPLCPVPGSDPPVPLPITRLRWEEEQALPFELCLRDTVACGNIVPAIAGETFTEHFVIGSSGLQPELPTVVERQGPLNELTGACSPVLLHSLAESEEGGLGWTGVLRQAEPEVELQEVEPATLSPPATPRFWEHRDSLLGSRPQSEHFTLDDGTWREVIRFRRLGEVVRHRDYASGLGSSVRFGDGEFGRIPDDGTVFRVRYRTGPGRRANLPADSVTLLADPSPEPPAVPWPTLAVAESVSNPFPITGGVDPETPEEIRQLAPEAFKASRLFAVRDVDYREIAERLPWVQRAGARARWTGSWLTELVTADPLGAFELSPERREELENLMDCVRQVGREVYVRNPRYVNLDLEVKICVEPSAHAGQVQERVVEALLGRRGVRPAKGFFDPDHFTFGTPLYRAALEAAIQAVAGVRGVEEMEIRARGITPWRPFEELIFPVGDRQILRLQGDPRHPERGSLKVRTQREVDA